MEQNSNIENQFRDKLNSREIEPTQLAWDRLDAMLSVAESKQPKKKINWLLIAAGFIGILFSGIVIFQLNTNRIISNNTIMVAQKTNSLSKKQNQINNKTKNSTSSNLNQIAKPIIQNQQLAAQTSIVNQKSTVKVIQNSNQKVQVAQNVVIENQISNNVATSKISVNPEALLASVEVLKPTPINSPAAITVNANSLLSQVNNELSQEFRETKFQKLKRNYQNVKVAMESRNNK